MEPGGFVLSEAVLGLLLVKVRALQLRRRVRIKCALLTGFPRLLEWTLEQSQASTQAQTSAHTHTQKSDNDHFIVFVSNPHRPLSLSPLPRAVMAYCWNQRPIRFISCPLTQRPRGSQRQTAKERDDGTEGGEELKKFLQVWVREVWGKTETCPAKENREKKCKRLKRSACTPPAHQYNRLQYWECSPLRHHFKRVFIGNSMREHAFYGSQQSTMDFSPRRKIYL